MAKPSLPARELAWPVPLPSGEATAAPPAKACIISGEIGPEDSKAMLVRAILHQLAQRDAHTAIGILEPGKLAIRRLVNLVARHATTRPEGSRVVVSVPQADWAARPEARS